MRITPRRNRRQGARGLQKLLALKRAFRPLDDFHGVGFAVGQERQRLHGMEAVELVATPELEHAETLKLVVDSALEVVEYADYRVAYVLEPRKLDNELGGDFGVVRAMPEHFDKVRLDRLELRGNVVVPAPRRAEYQRQVLLQAPEEHLHPALAPRLAARFVEAVFEERVAERPAAVDNNVVAECLFYRKLVGVRQRRGGIFYAQIYGVFGQPVFADNVYEKNPYVLARDAVCRAVLVAADARNADMRHVAACGHVEREHRQRVADLLLARVVFKDATVVEADVVEGYPLQEPQVLSGAQHHCGSVALRRRHPAAD